MRSIIFLLLLLPLVAFSQSKTEKKAMILYGLEEYPEAMVLFKAALAKAKEKPEKSRINHYIAESYINQVKVPPKAWNFKSLWYAQSKLLAEESIRYYRKSSMMRKGGPLYHWQIKIAEFYERMGMSLDALRAFEGYFNSPKKWRNPKFTGVAEAGVKRSEKVWKEESGEDDAVTYHLFVTLVESGDTTKPIVNATLKVKSMDSAIITSGKSNENGKWDSGSMSLTPGEKYMISVSSDHHKGATSEITAGENSVRFGQEFRLARTD
jgi:hypothetical protein